MSMCVRCGEPADALLCDWCTKAQAYEDEVTMWLTVYPEIQRDRPTGTNVPRTEAVRTQDGRMYQRMWVEIPERIHPEGATYQDPLGMGVEC
jgi:hypothetical protein